MSGVSNVTNRGRPLSRIVLTALGAALIAVGAFIAIPLPFSPVPLVLQNFFVLLISLAYGPSLSVSAVGLYLLMGALGLPVFAGGKGGFAHFFGPTGGYLMGFLLSAWVTGMLSQGQKTHGIEKGPAEWGPPRPAGSPQNPAQPTVSPRREPRTYLKDGVAALVGVLAVYLLGVPWLSRVLGLDLQKALAIGALPFMGGDLVKAVAAAALAPKVRWLLWREFFSVTGAEKDEGNNA